MWSLQTTNIFHLLDLQRNFFISFIKTPYILYSTLIDFSVSQSLIFLHLFSSQIHVNCFKLILNVNLIEISSSSLSSLDFYVLNSSSTFSTLPLFYTQQPFNSNDVRKVSLVFDFSFILLISSFMPNKLSYLLHSSLIRFYQNHITSTILKKSQNH